MWISRTESDRQEREYYCHVIGCAYLEPTSNLSLARTITGTLHSQQHSVSSTQHGWFWMSMSCLDSHWTMAPLASPDWWTLTLGLWAVWPSLSPAANHRYNLSSGPCWPWTYLKHILVLLSPHRDPPGHHGCRGRGREHLWRPGGHQV